MESDYSSIKKTSQNSLDDLLDIRKKNVRTSFFEKNDPDKTNIIKLKVKIDLDEINKIKEEPYTEMTNYMNKIFVKFNFSPIIDKIFPTIKKEPDYKIESLNYSWCYYNSGVKCCKYKTISDTFSKKILFSFITFVNNYLTHIFSIPKVSECLNLLSNKLKFKIYNFEAEDEKNKQQEIYLNIEKELKGKGCTFIVLKELRRLYDTLFFAGDIFIHTVFYNYFQGIISNLVDIIFYKHVIENEVVSTLLYQIKLIFETYCNNKEVVEFINLYTIEKKKGLKFDEYEKKINDIYNNPEFNGKRIYDGFEKEYDEIDKFNLDKIPTKVKYLYRDIKDLEKDYKLNGDEIEYEEDEKIKEMKDLDELAKYIQGEPKKKKKKKKKKKENPINMLAKLNFSDKILEDDQISMISHDTIFSNFKADIKNDNYEEENLIKIKPNISDKFIEDLINNI